MSYGMLVKFEGGENKYKQLKTDNNLGDSDDEAGLGEIRQKR